MTATISVPGQRGRLDADPLMQEARDRQRRRRLLIATAIVMVAGLTLYGFYWRGGGGNGVSSLSLHSAGAAELPHMAGWYGGSSPIPNESCERCVQVDSWASTTPFLDAPNDLPTQTMQTLDRNGVIVWIIRSWQPHEPTWALKAHPLRISPSLIHPNWEGNPTHGRVSLWLATTWRSGSSVEIYVYFGSPDPSPTVIARAQEELNATNYPSWKFDP